MSTGEFELGPLDVTSDKLTVSDTNGTATSAALAQVGINATAANSRIDSSPAPFVNSLPTNRPGRARPAPCDHREFLRRADARRARARGAG